MKQKIYLITGLMASGKSTVSDLLAKSIEKCVHLRGDVFRKMIISGRENMSATPSAEAVRQLYLRYKLTADAARSYFDNGFSVVIQDNYYGDELNRMINYLHKYPVEVVVLCPDVETIKERERYREKTGYSGFTVETLYDTFMQTTPRIGFWLDNSNQTPQETAETAITPNSLAVSPFQMLSLYAPKSSFMFTISYVLPTIKIQMLFEPSHPYQILIPL